MQRNREGMRPHGPEELAGPFMWLTLMFGSQGMGEEWILKMLRSVNLTAKPVKKIYPNYCGENIGRKRDWRLVKNCFVRDHNKRY